MTQKARGVHLFRPCQLFWGPQSGHFRLSGIAALQAVSECPLRRKAGILREKKFRLSAQVLSGYAINVQKLVISLFVELLILHLVQKRLEKREENSRI